jgi:hypothetical protein
MILSSELFKRGKVDIPPFVFTPIGVVKYFNVLWYTSRCLVHTHDIRTAAPTIRNARQQSIEAGLKENLVSPTENYGNSC